MAKTDVEGGLETSLASEDVVTVGQLNAELAMVVESATEVHHDYVVGDVTDCGVANNNVHFDLVANDASIHCVLFGFRRDSIGTEPDDDMRVAVQGDLSYYEARGSCSILVTDVVSVGESKFQQRYEEAREALAADGLLDEERKQSIPERPSTVGLITSADSDAASDTITAIHTRYPGVDIELHHASVQGERAVEELLTAISTLNRDEAIDVLVVTRGGGADKTLGVFNDPALCRVIARTDTPICVGVGHEEDRTLADEVADCRVMTPTHAGEIVPVKRDILDELEQRENALYSAYRTAVTARLDDHRQSVVMAYESHASAKVTALENQLVQASETLAATRITELERTLSAAYESLEQKKALESEQEAKLAAAEEDATARITRQRRRYRLIIVALGLLLVLLAAFFII